MASNAFDQFDAPASAGGNAFDQFDAGDLQARQDEWRKRTGNTDPSIPVPSTLDDSTGGRPRRFGLGHMIENASIAAGRSATAGLQDTAADANLVGGGAARLMGGDQQTQDEFFRRAQENSEGAARNRALAHDLSPTGAAAGEVLGLAPLLVGGAALAPERAVTAGRRGLRWLVDAGKHALPVASGIGQVQASRDAIDVLNRGGDAETAEKVYGTSFAANTAGNILPASVGGKVVTRLGTGAVLGGTAALGTQEGLHKVAPEYIAGPSAETALTGAGIGALFGGVMGGHGRTAPTKIMGEKPGVHAKIDPESDVESRRQAVSDIMSAAGEGDQAAQPDVSATKPPEDWRTKLAAKTDVPDELRQAIGSRFERAEKTLPVFDKDVREIADSVGGTPIVAPLKGVDRATSKIMSDYGGDASQIKDLVRGTIEIPSPDDLPKVEAQLREKYGEPIKFKSSLDPEKPAPFANGYRDLNSVWMIDGEPVELQVNVPEMLVAKKKAHPLYAKWQKIERQATNENRDPTPAEKAEMADLDSQQNAVYSEAWDAAMRRMNSSRGITSASSRNNEPETGSPSGQVRQTYASSDANRPSGNTPNTAAELNSGSGAERVSGSADMGVSSDAIVPRGSADWVQFPKDSGTLGIPRAEMPQIKQGDRGDFIQYLASKGIKGEKTTVPASELKPTQAEYSTSKAARFAETGPVGGTRDVLMSSDGYVLDGHHQAVAHKSLGTDVPVIRLDAPIRELLKAANEFPAVKRSEGADGRANQNQGVSDEQSTAVTEQPETAAGADQQQTEGQGGGAGRDVPRADAGEAGSGNKTDFPVIEAPISELALSEDVPQFKKGADGEGVVEPLGGKFDRRGVGPIQVWRRRDGRMEVISGRHRLDLARRSGEKTIPAQVYNEADGFSRNQAVTLDAELNIRDGQGSTADYVQYFKHNPAFEGPEGRAHAESRGLLARSKGRRAYAIASQGGGELIAAHRAGELSDEAAYQIAEAAPGDGRLQAVAMKQIQDGKTIANAVNTMRAVQAIAPDRGPAQTSGDMFGLDDSGLREAEGMAKVASAMQRAIDEQIRAVKGAAKRPDLAKRHGVDVHDPEAVKRNIQELEAEKQRLKNWHTDPELVAKIRDAMSGDNPAMSIRTGDERSGPALSNEDVEKAAAGVMGVDAVKRRVVVAPFEAFPAPIKRAAEEQGHAAGDIQGVNWHGKTYLVEGAFHSPAEVEAAIFHEHFTHHGLRVKYQNQLGARLGGLLHDVGGMDGLRALAKKQGIDLSGYEQGSTLPRSHQRVMMMEELLAHMSHATGTVKRKLQEFVGLVRDFLRRNGFAKLAKYGVTDLAHELRGAREAAMQDDARVGKGEPSFMRRPGAASGDLFGGRDEQAPRQRETAPAVENGDLFGGPTSADRLDAATRERDARRNGADRGGRSDMMAGDGELFAGDRPEQTDLAAGDENATEPTDARFSVRSDISDSQAEALGKIGVSAKVKPLKETLREYGNKIRREAVQGIVDQFAPLKDLDMTAYMQARMSRGTDGALEATFFHGTPKLTDGALDVQVDGTGFRGVLADLEGEQDLFFAWIAGNRAEALSKEWVVKADGKVIGRYADKAEANRAAIKMRSERPDELFGGSKSPEITAAPAGRERLFTDHQIAELKKLNQGTLPSGRKRADVYGQANGKFRTYQNAVLKIAEEAGLIDPEQRKVWADQFYVPFYRELDSADGKTQAMHGSASLVRQRAFEQLKGSEKPLNDLFENVMSNWSHLLTASMRNMAGEKALAAAEKMGVAHEISGPEKGSVWIMRGGKQVHYRVGDDMLLDAITSLSYNGIKGRAMDTLRAFKHALTIGVTISPTFRIRNLARDTMSALAVSDDAGWNPLANVAQGWKATGKDAETNIRLLAGGGKIHYGTLLDGQQAANAKRLVKEKIAHSGQILDTKEKVANAFKDGWEWWKDAGDKAETINRAVLYENARKAGKTHLEASYEARDLLDFTMGGKWTSIRFLTSTVPFMNARLQGLYKLGKAGRNNPARFAAVTGTVALASALNYLLQRDDPEYQQLPDWVRDTYWPVKLGDKMYFIPKPFEIGAMGSIVERVTELAVGGDDYKARDFAHTLANIIGDQLSMNPIPQAVKPIAEAAANYDMFQGHDIDNMAETKRSAKTRFTPTTSAGAIAVGRTINVSPKRIEHMVRGYFGWLGQQALNVSDLLARDAMDLPSNPRRDLTKVDNMFAIGDFVKDTKGEYSKYVDRLYELQDRVNRVYADLNYARKTGDVEGQAELRDAEELRLRPAVKSGAKQISNLRKRIKAVGNDRTLSAHEKRIQIDDLRQQQNDIARRTDQRVRELESRE